MVNSTTATTIYLFWSALSGTVDSYVIMWKRDTSGECSEEDVGSTTISSDFTSYNITGLEEDSNYTITVAATNVAGSATSDAVTGITGEAAPSAPPTSVLAFDVTCSSISVQWGAVDCIHINGNITGYIVKYEEQDSGYMETMSIMGRNTTKVTISRLDTSTIYSIAVAAVNHGGIGVYSHPIMAETKGEKNSLYTFNSQCVYVCNVLIVLHNLPLKVILAKVPATKNSGGYAVGGFVGGVLITAVLGTVIHFLLLRKRRLGYTHRGFLMH